MIINEIFEQVTETVAHNCSNCVWAWPQLKGPVHFHPSLAGHFPRHIHASIWHYHFGMCYWIPLAPQQSDPSLSTTVVEGFTLFITVKLQPILTDKTNHKTTNCTVQLSVLMPHYEKNEVLVQLLLWGPQDGKLQVSIFICKIGASD